MIFLHFDVSGNDQPGLFIPPPRYTVFDHTYPFELLLNRVLEVEDSQQLWKAEEFDILLKQILISVYRSHCEKNHSQDHMTPSQIRKIRELIQYIRSESGRRLKHDELVKQADLSPHYLNVLFIKYTRVSIREFITRTRLERAMHLLTETNMNVSEVSKVLGYSDIYVFSKLFKRYFGINPSYVNNKSRLPRPHIG